MAKAKDTTSAITLRFKLERETKNTFRFQEVDQDGNALDMADASVGTLYVKKVAFPDLKAPEALSVTIA